MNTIKIFYSYSHKDEHFQEKLETHLSILKKNKYIEEWHDRRISAGQDWEEELNLNLEEAHIILLLVSSNFLASDYCYDTETIRALEKHKAKEARVIPIILTPCLWLESELKTLQGIPKDGKPISTWDNEDEAWIEVSKKILEIVKEIQTQTISKPSRPSVTQPAQLKPDELILKFLKLHSKWFFSPLRIQKWGSKQYGFSDLQHLSTSKIRHILEELRALKKVKITKSQKGNTIYKAI